MTGLVHEPLLHRAVVQEGHAISKNVTLSGEYSTEPIQPFPLNPRRLRLEKAL